MANNRSLRSYSLLSSFLVLSFMSCRVSDADREDDILGPRVSVSLNVLGSVFSDAGDESSSRSASLSSQEHSFLVDPSTVVVSHLRALSPLTSLSASSATSAAATPGPNLSSGTRFRVIAYDSSGNYNAYQDYVVGAPPTPLMLNAGSNYTIVVYSYNSTSGLPAISSGELGSLSSASVLYDDSKRDFMYYSTSYTPNSANNTLNITLRHKVAQLTTTLSSGILNSEISSISNPLLTPHYSNGSFSLSTGNISGQTSLSSGAALIFPGPFPASSITSNSVFVNSNTGGNLTGSFTASLVLGGNSKVVSVPNSFKITPGYQSGLNISLVNCGGYLGAGNTSWKNFMCYNLGADSSVNPFIAQASIHGAKYQWGRLSAGANQSVDQSNSGAIVGWNTTNASDGAWSDSNRTANDPCPTGYKVPSQSQWQALSSSSNNTISYVGPWVDNSSNPGDWFGSGTMIGITIRGYSFGWRWYASGAWY
ncbi:hypothetical protein HZQ32_03705 [Elizabethkingia anophelis]|nr:hypothetical protein [Elizabethkingia anophelis]